MSIHHTELPANFDQETYSSDCPVGTWKARVDQAVYSKGTSPWQRGKGAGIHLYVQHEEGQKIWLFVPLLPALAAFAAAAELEAGDVIEVEISTSKSGLSIAKELRKVGQFLSAEEERNSQTYS